jgi:hypothetical protein
LPLLSFDPCGVTTTSKLLVAALPLESVALQLTFVVPIENVDPEAGLQDVDGDGSAVSVAFAE